MTCNCPESGTSGSCPFHDSSTTRFTVEPQPGRWDTKLGRIVTALEDAVYERARAEATAAAEQRLRERIAEAELDASEEARRFVPPFEGGFREGARWALNRWRSALDSKGPE